MLMRRSKRARRTPRRSCARSIATPRDPDAAPEHAVAELAVVPGAMAVDPGRDDGRAEPLALERRPAAFRERLFAPHDRRSVGAAQHEIGEPAFAHDAA